MGNTMWFLIKTGFWFSLVLVLLPVFSTQSSSRLQNDPQVQVSDAVSAASGAFQYVSALCYERPDVCVKGGETLTALGYRAREGARIAYEFIDQQLGDGKSGAAPIGSASLDGGKIAGKLTAAATSLKIDPATISKIEAAATSQPMPAKLAPSETADAVVTGTVSHAAIPVPRPKPAI
jgi:hypothetical protein